MQIFKKMNACIAEEKNMFVHWGKNEAESGCVEEEGRK